MNEKLLFDEYLRICELTIDSMIEMDRHKHVLDTMKTRQFQSLSDLESPSRWIERDTTLWRYYTMKTRQFQSLSDLESPSRWIERDRHCYRRSRYSQREGSLVEAWGKEVNSLCEILATIQGDLLLLVKKCAQERAFKVSLRNDFDQDLVNLIRREQQACTQPDSNIVMFCLTAIRWLNELNVKVSSIGKEERKISRATTASNAGRIQPPPQQQLLLNNNLLLNNKNLLHDHKILSNVLHLSLAYVWFSSCRSTEPDAAVSKNTRAWSWYSETVSRTQHEENRRKQSQGTWDA